MANPGQELSTTDFRNIIGGPLRAVVEAQAESALSTVNFIKSVGFKAGDSTDPEATNTGEPIYVKFQYPKEVAPYQPAIPASFTIEVTDGGAGYDPNNPPAVTISAPSSGTAATAQATVSGGKVSAVTLTSSGSGYTSAPTSITIAAPTSGTTATAQPKGFVGAVPASPAQIQQMELNVPILTMLPIPYLRVEKMTVDFNAKIESMEFQNTETNFSIAANLQAQQRWPSGSAKLNVSAAYQRKTTQGSTVNRTYSMAVHVEAQQDDMPGGMEKIMGILESAMRAQPTNAPKALVTK